MPMRELRAKALEQASQLPLPPHSHHSTSSRPLALTPALQQDWLARGWVWDGSRSGAAHTGRASGSVRGWDPSREGKAQEMELCPGASPPAPSPSPHPEGPAAAGPVHAAQLQVQTSVPQRRERQCSWQPQAQRLSLEATECPLAAEWISESWHVSTAGSSATVGTNRLQLSTHGLEESHK